MSNEKQFIQAYSKLKLNHQDFEVLQQIEKQKKQFNTFFNKVHHDKNYFPNNQEIEMQEEYLDSVYKLMRMGLKVDYILVQDYSQFLRKEQIRHLKGDIISSLVSEFLFSRYTYSLGSIKFLKKKLQLHNKDYLKNNNFDELSMKEIIQIFNKGFLRLAKINQFKGKIFQQIEQNYKHIIELKEETFSLIYKVNLINFTNLIVYQSINKFYFGKMEEQQMDFLLCIFKEVMSQINEVSIMMKHFTFYQEYERLKAFLEHFYILYSLLFNTILLQKNKFIENEINWGHQQKLSVSQIYYENYMICQKIFEQEKQLEEMKNKRNSSIFPYLKEVGVFKQNDSEIFSTFIVNFYQKIRNKDLLKQGIKYFEQMKDDIMSNLDKKSTWDDIFNRFQSQNLIQKKIENMLKINTQFNLINFFRIKFYYFFYIDK